MGGGEHQDRAFLALMGASIAASAAVVVILGLGWKTEIPTSARLRPPRRAELASPWTLLRSVPHFSDKSGLKGRSPWLLRELDRNSA